MMKPNANFLPGSELCMLLVEDNSHMRTLLRTLLKGMGFQRILEYSDGAQALEQLGTTRPDFILTDLSMAPMDGLQFTRSVRRLPSQDLCVIPIIMVTGHTERRRIKAARDAGVSEILAKPVTAGGLYHRINEIVHRPRPFVRSPDYCGPCRRRKVDPDYFGPWRRVSDAGMADMVALDEGPPPAKTPGRVKRFL
jgi:two-component system chemotaxis response regulator CheY